MVAASRLQAAGVDVIVLEASEQIGGRIQTMELRPGWCFDRGAHAYLSNAREVTALTKGLEVREIVPWPWATPDLLVGDKRMLSPFAGAAAARAFGLSDDWLPRLMQWSAAQAQPEPYVPAPDDRDAEEVLTSVAGPLGVRSVYPSLEHALGWPARELSAAHVQSLLRREGMPRPLVIADGMIAPFQRLAAGLDVRTGVKVTRVGPGFVEPFGAVDAVIVAVPAPVAAQIVDRGAPGRPGWIEDVPYSSEVTVTAFQQHGERTAWSDVVNTDAGEGVERVTLLPGGGEWCPKGYRGASITASRLLSARLAGAVDGREASDAEVIDLLFRLGKELEPELFPASAIDVVTVAKHRYAWPRWSAAHATRVSAWLQRPPIVFAGDWTWHPFVEGAVRSGQRAADVLIRGWLSG